MAKNKQDASATSITCSEPLCGIAAKKLLKKDFFDDEPLIIKNNYRVAINEAVANDGYCFLLKAGTTPIGFCHLMCSIDPLVPDVQNLKVDYVFVRESFRRKKLTDHFTLGILNFQQAMLAKYEDKILKLTHYSTPVTQEGAHYVIRLHNYLFQVCQKDGIELRNATGLVFIGENED